MPFFIQSISKPFINGLALKDHENEESFYVNDRMGLNASERAFNSIVAISEKDDHKQNLMVGCT